MQLIPKKVRNIVRYRVQNIKDEGDYHFKSKKPDQLLLQPGGQLLRGADHSQK